MIQRHYSLDKPYAVALYARMSDKTQNKRSPEQQAAAVNEVMRRCNCPWTVVKLYVDRGIKGRYIKRRPGLQDLLRDIALDRICVDLIAVDTLERFGRADEVEAIRRKLLVERGVMIVAADNNFADPTGIVGKAVGMIEQVRSTEEGRIKAHQVIRGKKDALRQKRWPGGPPPFGYRLKRCVDDSGQVPTLYSVLEPDPATAPILRQVFAKTHETGWGGGRLAKCFNADPSIPDSYKPFYAPTIVGWLGNEIYVGIGVWGQLCTDIINDARVIEPNPHPDEIVRVEDFCEPLVSREVFDAVGAVRKARRRPKAAAGVGGGGEKLIEPLSPGLSLKHALAGLVHCGDCNACSVPRSSGRRSKAGQEYTYYTCPRHNDGACGNARHVRVDRLEPAVFAALRKRLLPPAAGAVPEWFPSIVARVEAHVRRMSEDEPRRAEQIRAQVGQLEQQLGGWRQSLGNPQLSADVRQDLEREYQTVKERKARLESDLAAEQALQGQVKQLVDPRRVVEALQRLEEILAAENACLVNLELGRHIERVDCYADGRVVMRGTWLGLFDGAVELLSGAGDDLKDAPQGSSAAGAAEDAPSARSLPRVLSRRLARRRVDTLSDQSAAPGAGGGGGNDTLDPDRFAGLAECFLWREDFAVERMPCWSETHAAEVAALWVADPKHWTMPRLAERWGVSIPTARKALRIGQAAAGINVEARTLAPRGVHDHRSIADEAARLYLRAEPPKLSIRHIAGLLKVNQVTVSKALDYWYVSQGRTRPDGRSVRTTRVAPATPAAPHPGPGADPAIDAASGRLAPADPDGVQSPPRTGPDGAENADAA